MTANGHRCLSTQTRTANPKPPGNGQPTNTPLRPDITQTRQQTDHPPGSCLPHKLVGLLLSWGDPQVALHRPLRRILQGYASTQEVIQWHCCLVASLSPSRPYPCHSQIMSQVAEYPESAGLPASFDGPQTISGPSQTEHGGSDAIPCHTPTPPLDPAYAEPIA